MFWPTLILPGILFTLLAVYPFIEAKVTGDKESHNLLQRPRETPTRTGLGAFAITFYLVLWISGGNDVIAKTFDISLNAMTWAGRVGAIVLPPIVFYFTRKLCIHLQERDREIAEHGIETGIIQQLPNGEFVEEHRPKLPPVPDHPRVPTDRVALPSAGDAHAKGALVRRAGRAVSGFFVEEEERQPEPTGSSPQRSEGGH